MNNLQEALHRLNEEENILDEKSHEESGYNYLIFSITPYFNKHNPDKEVYFKPESNQRKAVNEAQYKAFGYMQNLDPKTYKHAMLRIYGVAELDEIPTAKQCLEETYCHYCGWDWDWSRKGDKYVKGPGNLIWDAKAEAESKGFIGPKYF